MPTQSSGSQNYPFVVQFADVRPRVLMHAYAHLITWQSPLGPDPFWRLYWNPGPGAFVDFKGRTYSLGPDTLFLIPPDTQYTTRLRHQVDHFFIHFAFENSRASIDPQILVFGADPTRRRLLEGVMQGGTAGTLGTFAGGMLLHELILNLFAEVPPESWHERSLDRRIIRALSMMEEALELRRNPSAVDNTALAHDANMSVDAFIRLFTAQMKISPMRYFLDRRLSRAAIQLQHSDRSVDHIADECGFCDRDHLAKAFIRKFATTPAAYRKRTLAS